MKLLEIDPLETQVSAIEAWKPPTESQVMEHLQSAMGLLNCLQSVVDPHVVLALNNPSNVAMGRIFAAMGVIMNDSRLISEQKGVEFGPVEMLALGVFYAPIMTEAYLAECSRTTKQLEDLE